MRMRFPVALGAALVAVVLGCLVGKDPKLKEPFSENFDSGRLDPQVWRLTSEAYEVVDGALYVQGAKKHPMWLQKRIPCDVKIDFVAWADTAEGDIEVEVFGDGRSAANEDGDYVGTGYVVKFGGWNNKTSTIARRDENEARMAEDQDKRVEPGRRYQWSIRVRGGKIDWFLDGRLFLHAEDHEPLCGPGNDHFAFDNWSSKVHFDDLSITPL